MNESLTSKDMAALMCMVAWSWQETHKEEEITRTWVGYTHQSMDALNKNGLLKTITNGKTAKITERGKELGARLWVKFQEVVKEMEV